MSWKWQVTQLYVLHIVILKTNVPNAHDFHSLFMQPSPTPPPPPRILSFQRWAGFAFAIQETNKMDIFIRVSSLKSFTKIHGSFKILCFQPPLYSTGNTATEKVTVIQLCYGSWTFTLHSSSSMRTGFYN